MLMLEQIRSQAEAAKQQVLCCFDVFSAAAVAPAVFAYHVHHSFVLWTGSTDYCKRNQCECGFKFGNINTTDKGPTRELYGPMWAELRLVDGCEGRQGVSCTHDSDKVIIIARQGASLST